MSQKRVAIVLASLVGTMTLGAGVLLVLEPPPLKAPPAMQALSQQDVSNILQSDAPIQDGRWSYIIIYQSGEPAGTANDLAAGRSLADPQHPTADRARWPAAFHFVVDNGSAGTPDGTVERGPAWVSQQSAAPFAAWPDARYARNGVYREAIGVCLVGDVDRQAISDAQTHNLTELVAGVQRQLNIAPACVRFQWELTGNPPTEAQAAYAAQIRQLLAQ